MAFHLILSPFWRVKFFEVGGWILLTHPVEYSVSFLKAREGIFALFWKVCNVLLLFEEYIRKYQQSREVVIFLLWVRVDNVYYFNSSRSEWLFSSTIALPFNFVHIKTIFYGHVYIAQSKLSHYFLYQANSLIIKTLSFFIINPILDV